MDGELTEVVDQLWRDGVGPDDRRQLALLLDDPALVGAPQRVELATFRALVEMMWGVAATAPAPIVGAPARTCALSAAAAVWSAVLVGDRTASDLALDALERALRAVADDDPDLEAARGWADLAIAEAALLARMHGVARRRLETVARGRAPTPLRVIATLRIATILAVYGELEQAQQQCRHAAALAGGARPLLAEYAHLAGALLADAA